MTHDMATARSLLAASRYDGKPVVVLSPTDPLLAPLGDVTAALLRQLGMVVELVRTDGAGWVARRASQAAPEAGGWSIFHAAASAADFASPATNVALRGNGRAGWPGWPADDMVERLRAAWFETSDASARERLARAIDERAFETVPYVPLGQVSLPSLRRRNLQSIVPASAPLFWRVHKV